MGKDSGWLSEKKEQNKKKKNLSSNLASVFSMPAFSHSALKICLCPAGVKPENFWEKEDHKLPAAGPRTEGECLCWPLC